MKNNKLGHLILVRHGESEWNEKGLWTGWQDINLTRKGRNEARLAAKSILDIKFDVAVSSDLKRAHETLEIIKKEIGLEVATIKHTAYRERHYGIYTGKSKWDIKKLVGEEKFQKIRRSWDEVIPEGETLKDVYNRVVPHFVDNLLPLIKNGKSILIVAHGNTHRALIKYLENISHEGIADIELATGEVIIYKIDQKGQIIHKEKRAVNTNMGKQ